jgi:hypothetical protein
MLKDTQNRKAEARASSKKTEGDQDLTSMTSVARLMLRCTLESTARVFALLIISYNMMLLKVKRKTYVTIYLYSSKSISKVQY